jgi:hypothetical protein
MNDHMIVLHMLQNFLALEDCERDVENGFTNWVLILMLALPFQVCRIFLLNLLITSQPQLQLRNFNGSKPWKRNTVHCFWTRPRNLLHYQQDTKQWWAWVLASKEHCNFLLRYSQCRLHFMESKRTNLNSACWRIALHTGVWSLDYGSCFLRVYEVRTEDWKHLFLRRVHRARINLCASFSHFCAFCNMLEFFHLSDLLELLSSYSSQMFLSIILASLGFFLWMLVKFGLWSFEIVLCVPFILFSL